MVGAIQAQSLFLMVSNFLQRLLSCLAHMETKKRNILIALFPNSSHVPIGPMFAWVEKENESCNPHAVFKQTMGLVIST